MNDYSHGMYNTNSQIKFEASVLKSSLCDYSDAYIHVKGTITILNTEGAGAAANNSNKKVAFKNCAPFTDCISEISNTQVDNAEDIDVVMPMYNLIEYSDNYFKASGSLWQYNRDEPAIDFLASNNNSFSLNFKGKITGQTGDNGTKVIDVMISLKYLSNFWRILTWSAIGFIVAGTMANQVPKFAIADVKLYVVVVNSLTYQHLQ